jgi:hypothetical protein
VSAASSHVGVAGAADGEVACVVGDEAGLGGGALDAIGVVSRSWHAAIAINNAIKMLDLMSRS